MLKKISISNFKGFRTELVFDLSSDNKYTFNEKCIKNNIVNNCMIYGYNGCGKSNLGLGIFDIIGHLTDKHKDKSKYQFYTNGFAPNEPASFCYEFLINGSTIQYSYKKLDYVNLLYEKLSINDREVVVFDRSHENTFFTSLLEGTETLNKEINDRKLSAIKFIRNNSSLTETTENKAFLDFYNFIDGMLFFRSLEDRTFIGQEADENRTITSEIIQKNKVEDFQKLLHEANINCELSVEETVGGQELVIDFENRKLPFPKLMSTGTSALMLFFYWYMILEEQRVSFIFIDEFDAFYHRELSKLIIEKLKNSEIQFVLTTHNVSLMTNDLMRPDCIYLMGNNQIKPLSHCTNKQIREEHNIEKIYKSGGFNVN